jgi:hypothetical protein
MSHIQDTIEELTAQQEAKKSSLILFRELVQRSGRKLCLFSTLNLTMLKVELLVVKEKH